MSTGGNFWLGQPGQWSQQSLLAPNQQGLQSQLLGSGQGAFGQAADYYRSLLSDNNSTYNAFAQPELRRFREQIVPDIAEQFAGMGSGGLSSSGFRNAAVNAGADLSERLGALRAQLRQQGAAGLMGIGEMGLRPTVENIYTQGQPGFLHSLLGTAGQVAGMYLNPYGSLFNRNPQQQTQPDQTPIKGSTSPYGTPSALNRNFQLPQFNPSSTYSASSPYNFNSPVR